MHVTPNRMEKIASIVKRKRNKYLKNYYYRRHHHIRRHRSRRFFKLKKRKLEREHKKYTEAGVYNTESIGKQ